MTATKQADQCAPSHRRGVTDERFDDWPDKSRSGGREWIGRRIKSTAPLD